MQIFALGTDIPEVQRSMEEVAVKLLVELPSTTTMLVQSKDRN